MFKISFIFFFVIVINLLHSQPIANTADTIALSNAIDTYSKAINEESRLYNGREYIEYKSLLVGHPFFESKDWKTGFIYYDGSKYENVNILLDLLTDQVVIKIRDYAKVQLIKEKIKYFSIWDHVFINISTDSANKVSIAPGFYDLLADGKTALFAKRYKTLYESISNQGQLQREVVIKNKYYICKDNLYYPADSKRAVLNVYKDKKKELGKYLRKNKIRFRKNREYAIIKMAEYYNTTEN